MPLDALTATLSLCMIARTSLRSMFEVGGHSPSVEQWSAIDDLLRHLERAADGALDRAVYVSAIPAGTGKTATIAQFAKALMGTQGRHDVGMLVTCNRVEEVRDMAILLGEWRQRLCVIVGKDNTDVLALGDHEAADEAQVVICTQEALKRTLKSVTSFDDASRFHYQGRRRAVVAWDEAFAFSRPVVLDLDEATRLTKAIRSQSEAAKTALLRWTLEVDGLPPGQCQVPDFEALGVDFRALEETVADDDEAAAQAKALAIISGGTGYLMRDNLTGAQMVSHVPEIPSSLMPVIVTDASAARGVRHESYEFMARHRPVRWLMEASKTYQNLTLRIVPTAASRSVYRDRSEPRGRILIDMAVSYIRRVTPEPVLVIGYRNRFVMRGVRENTIEAAIRARLTTEENARVSYLTWGRHTATNAYADRRHVVLMGLNYLPRPAAHAAAGAALELPMSTNNPEDHPTLVEVEAMRRGMLRDSTLQAILRGHARKSAGGDCGVMTAVVPQVRQTGLSETDYMQMFPGVSIVADASLLPAKPLRGKLKELSGRVLARMAAGENQMEYPELGRELGMEAANFRDLVKKPEWHAWAASVGLAACRFKGRTTGLRRV